MLNFALLNLGILAFLLYNFSLKLLGLNRLVSAGSLNLRWQVLSSTVGRLLKNKNYQLQYGY